MEGANKKTFTLKHEGAPYIILHWKHIQLSSGTSLQICDGDGNNCDHPHKQGEGGHPVHTFWDFQVSGDTIVMVLTSTDNVAGSFAIDEYAAGWPLDSFGNRRSICGTDDRRNAICYKDSYPDHYAKDSRNVCQYISCVASTFHLSEEIGFLPDFENCVGTGGGTCQACERYLHRMVRITLATLCAYSMPS